MTARQPSDPGPGRAGWWWMGVITLGGLLLAAYANSFSVPFVMDDLDSIVGNPTIHSWRTALFPPAHSGLTVSGRPVLNATLALNYAVGGTEVAGYHAVNLAIHWLAALTLWGVVTHTLRLPVLREKFGTDAAALGWSVAALWALHPLQTESVTYVIQRAESLAGLFYLVTLYVFVRHAENPRTRWVVLAGAACWFGVGTKETVVTLPVVVLLYDRTFVSGSWLYAWRRHRAMHLAIASGWLGLGLLLTSAGGRGETVGFAPVAWWRYALDQGPAVLNYLRLAVLPFEQVFDYGAAATVPDSPLMWTIGGGGMVALVGATALADRRWPQAGFLGAWFLIILLPSSSVVPVLTEVAAEHRMYLSLAAVIAIGLFAAWRLGGRGSRPLFAVLVLLAGFATHRRNAVYADEVTLWQDTAAKQPDNPRALNNLGAALMNAGRVPEARRYLDEAVELLPTYADAHFNRGLVFYATGRPAEGRAEIDRAIRLSPWRAPYHAMLGHLEAGAANWSAAVTELTQARELDPSNEAYRYALAEAEAALKLHREAESGKR